MGHCTSRGWVGEVKNDMSGESKDALGVCNVKIRKSLMGAKQASFQDASRYKL